MNFILCSFQGVIYIMAIMSNDKYCHENKQPIARLSNEKCVGILIIEYFPKDFPFIVKKEKKKLLLLCLRKSGSLSSGHFEYSFNLKVNLMSLMLNLIYN